MYAPHAEGPPGARRASLRPAPAGAARPALRLDGRKDVKLVSASLNGVALKEGSDYELTERSLTIKNPPACATAAALPVLLAAMACDAMRVAACRPEWMALPEVVVMLPCCRPCRLQASTSCRL